MIEESLLFINILDRQNIRMENTRYYQLALKLQNYTRSRSLKSPLAPLPYHIEEEEDSNMVESKHYNIFDGPIETAVRVGPDLMAPYQYVGVKEMKSYISKTDKKRRHNNTMFKRSTSNLSTISLSRISQIRPPPERYLSKEEVMNRYTHVPHQLSQGNSFIEETYLNNQTAFLQKTLSPNTTILATTLGCKTENSNQRGNSHDFSLKKVLNKMKKYQRVWDNQAWQKQKRGLKKRRINTKLTSLLKNTEQFRSKVEEQQQNTVFQQIQNIQPKLWDRALRTSKTMVNFCEKNIEKIVKTDLISTGRNKYEKEVEWIDEKDRQGMVFRAHKGQKESIK